MKIACINYQPVSLYRDQGWSIERLGNYYNPTGVANEVLVAAYEEKTAFDFPQNVHVEGYLTQSDLNKIVVDFKPDVIRCYEANYPFCLMALNLARQMNVPSYLSLHDSRKRHVRQLADYTVITAYTETVQRMAKARTGKDVELQLNGIDSKFFDPTIVSEDDVKLTKLRLGIKDCDFLIYTIGRDDPLVNIPVQCKAVDLFRKVSGVDAQFVISGPGFEDGRLNDLGFVHAIGKTTQADIRAIHSISNCFMQVRIVPEISMAVTEALMMGVPVIHASGDETEKRLRWPIGITVDDPSDPYMIADYLEFLWRNLDEAKAASKNRRNMTVSTYDEEMWRKWEADRYRRLYEKSIEWKRLNERVPHGN